MQSDHGRARREPANEEPISETPEDAPRTPLPTFGVPVAGITYTPRHATYAIIRNRAGAVAAVQEPAGYWLPGGGVLLAETPEETVVREIREELGCTLRVVRRIGEALQYFVAAAEGRYYAMQAVYFLGDLLEEAGATAEYSLCWLDVSAPGPWFFHRCHDWAVQQI